MYATLLNTLGIFTGTTHYRVQNSLFFFKILPCKVFKEIYIYTTFPTSAQSGLLHIMTWDGYISTLWRGYSMCLNQSYPKPNNPTKQAGHRWQSSSWDWNIILSMELKFLWKYKKYSKESWPCPWWWTCPSLATVLHKYCSEIQVCSLMAFRITLSHWLLVELPYLNKVTQLCLCFHN